MYLHIRKYQLVNARWRDVIDLTDYEETIRQVVGTLFGNDFIATIDASGFVAFESL